MKATGGELVVIVLTSALDEEEGARAPGCQKLLKVGHVYTLPTEGTYSVSVIAESGSASRFSFNPAATKNSLWDGPDGFFQPFELGARGAAPFRARAVEIRTLGGRPVLSARSPGGGDLLAVRYRTPGNRLLWNY